MKKTLNIDAQLLREAKEACGAGTDTEAVRQGLQLLVQREAARQLAAFRGREPDALEHEVPRRREPARLAHRG